MTRANQTLSFSKDGTMVLTVDAVLSQDPLTMVLSGPGHMSVLTTAGVIQPQIADFSGIHVTATLGSLPLFDGPFDEFAPGYDSEITPVAYSCKASTLTLIGATGHQYQYAKT